MRCSLCGGLTSYGRCPSGVCQQALAEAGDVEAREEIAHSNRINGYAPPVWEES